VGSDAELVQQRGQQARTADAPLGGLVTELVGRPVHMPGPETVAGQEQGEGVAVVVPAVAVL
jgi:hypothetical protein